MINDVLQQNGSSDTLWSLFRSARFLDARDSTALDATFFELGDPREIAKFVTLGDILNDPDTQAYTISATRSIYFGPNGFNGQEGLTTAHELLHTAFPGGHAPIARALGLPSPPGFEDWKNANFPAEAESLASTAIDNFFKMDVTISEALVGSVAKLFITRM